MADMPIDMLFLMGGGPALVSTVRHCLKLELPTQVLTTPRQLADMVETGVNLELALSRAGSPPPRVCTDPLTELAGLVTASSTGLSVSAGWILKREVISLFGGRLYNLHSSDLPRCRGGGGHSWKILAGDRAGGLTFHVLDEGVDTGAVVMQDLFTFPESCRTPADYQHFIDARMEPFIAEFLMRLKYGPPLESSAQDESVSTYWPRLDTRLHGLIDWSWSVGEIEAFINAFDSPYPGARTWLRGHAVHLKCCSRSPQDKDFHPFQAGLVYRCGTAGVFVAAKGGGLLVGSVADDAGKDVTASIRPGSRLYTPGPRLDEARESTVTYGPEGRIVQRH